MAIDTSSPRSRRAMLGASVGALAATVATALGRPDRAAAGGGYVVLGQNNESSDTYTGFTRTDLKSQVTLAGPTYGVGAYTSVDDGTALTGTGTGERGVGVEGRTFGDDSQIGVHAVANNVGYGLYAESVNGIAIHAVCPGGYALQVVGRMQYSRSGKITFAQGQSSRKISSQVITPSSLVLATIQGNVAGTYVRGVSLDEPGDTFTIRLNKPAP